MTDSPLESEAQTDPSLGRRTFLRHSVVSLGVTVQEFVKHRDSAPPPPQEFQPVVQTGWLRPPGAVEETLFLERCTRCDDCLDACPHEAIVSLAQDQTPGIFPGEAPCFLCDDFPCINACETEALVPVRGVQGVNIGLAQVSHQACTAPNGCHACVAKCPTGAISLDFGSFRIGVEETLCVGCGICQHVCQTVNDRAAIRVTPNFQTLS